MTNEEIAKLFERAPEGATHYNDTNNMFYMFVSSEPGQFWSASRKEWLEASSIDEYSSMIERPTAWNGEGLPPVGTVCEAMVPASVHRLVMVEGYAWSRVEVCKSGMPGAERECLVFDLETTSPCWADEFRPLLTPEQIAAEKREKGILQLARDAGFWWHDCVSITELPPVMAAIYDAGYRKPEGGAQ